MSKYPSDKPNKNKRVRQYAKYSGLPFQLFGLIAIFGYLGFKLDNYFQNQNQYLTASFILIAFVAFMYKLFVMLNNEK